ncbi:MAG TPA: hypothetical protein VKE69_14825 [Planctomycetota bacterium]|nr:hypothetical protein [Planctomycetota bacterium]
MPPEAVLSFSIVLALACAAARQESAPGSRPASAPALRATGDPKAVAFLADAAARRAPAGEPEIADISLDFEAVTNVEQHNEFKAEHRYLRPKRVRTHLHTSTSDVERGFDGSAFWLKKGDRVETLEGREYEKDRKEIEASIRFTENVLRLVSLRSLAEQLSDIGWIEPTAEDPRPGVRGNLASFVSIGAGEPAPAHVQLRFDPTTFDLVEVRATPFQARPSAAEEPPPPGDTFLLSDYEVVRGARFPRHIVAFTRSERRPEYEIAVTRVSWNDGLAPTSFSPASSGKPANEKKPSEKR